MIREIHTALDRVEADEDVRVLVVQGAGRAFSAGFDLKESAPSRSAASPPGGRSSGATST